MKTEADKIRKLSCWHTGVQSIRWGRYGVPVCTEKEAYTQVHSQGDMECLSVLRRNLHTGVQSGDGVPVCTEKEPTHRCTVRVMECLSVLRRKPTHRCTVRVIWSACLYWEEILHTGVQSGSCQGDMECLSVLRRKPTHRCTVRVIWSVCLYWEEILHTGVQSGSCQGDMECLSVLRRKPTHRCTVRVMEYLSVLRRKPTHRCTVRVRSGWWSACLYWEGILHTGVLSGSCQGDMECLSVLRRKPTHRCTVRVIWSACLYWEGSLTGPVGAYHAIECTGFQARVQTMSAWLTTPTTCWTHWRASQSQHTEPAQTSSLCSWAPPLWAILFWLMLILSVAEKTYCGSWSLKDVCLNQLIWWCSWLIHVDSQVSNSDI